MNLPTLRPLSSDVSATAQLETAAMALLAQAGFKSVINNRPDHEGGPDQPTSVALEGAAAASGLAYAYLPVGPAYQSPEEAARFRDLLNTLPKPIVVFCRTGTRSGKLFQAAMSL
ncbi:MAG: sulfur transferase domain-containing protein [Pseudomonadota bacterium]|nr:sulfur transferase domain-containing protein [Pseudomonadota bacterium]